MGRRRHFGLARRRRRSGGICRGCKKAYRGLQYRRKHLPFARVLEDHAHAAQLVAEHFLSRGFVHFMFYSDTDNWSYEERGDGFVEALKRSGHECVWLRWHRSPDYRNDREQWKRKRDGSSTQLRRAPGPLAVFAANDEQALEVLESCESAGLNVPEQVAIVGAENYLLAPDAMHTPVSSVDTNLEMLGYTGAAMLEDLMNGKPAQSRIYPRAGRRYYHAQKQRPAGGQAQGRGQQPAFYLGACQPAD